MNNSPEQNGINRRAFIRNALKSATVLSTVPAVALSDGLASRTENMVLTFDVKRDKLRGYTALGPVYNVAPVDDNEWQRYLSGELQPRIIEGRITGVFTRRFIWTEQRTVAHVFWEACSPWHYNPSGVIAPIGPYKKSFDLKMFQVQSSERSFRV